MNKPPRPMPRGTAATAQEKFRLGQRVRLSALGEATLPLTAIRKRPVYGVVTGFTVIPSVYVRVRRLATRPRVSDYHMDFWEPLDRAAPRGDQ